MVKTKKATITSTPSTEKTEKPVETVTTATVTTGQQTVVTTTTTTTATPVVKVDNEENVVYVFKSKQTEHIPSMSPECLALETYMRFRNINYKYATDKCIEKPHGEPICLLNGKEYVGFDKILEALGTLPNLEQVTCPELTDDQHADGQAFVCALIMGILHQCLNVQRFRSTTLPAELDIIKRFKSGFQKLFKVNKDEDRLTKLKPEQLVEVVKDNLGAINNYLQRPVNGKQEKLYFFGDSPTKYDAIVFGLLAQYWQEPPTAAVCQGSTTDFSLCHLTESIFGSDAEKSAAAEEKKPTNKILPYLENIKNVYWPDWKEKCLQTPPPTMTSPSKRGTFRKQKNQQPQPQQQQQQAVTVTENKETATNGTENGTGTNNAVADTENNKIVINGTAAENGASGADETAQKIIETAAAQPIEQKCE